MGAEFIEPEYNHADDVWAGDVRTAEIAVELRRNADLLRQSIR